MATRRATTRMELFQELQQSIAKLIPKGDEAQTPHQLGAVMDAIGAHFVSAIEKAANTPGSEYLVPIYDEALHEISDTFWDVKQCFKEFVAGVRKMDPEEIKDAGLALNPKETAQYLGMSQQGLKALWNNNGLGLTALSAVGPCLYLGNPPVFTPCPPKVPWWKKAWSKVRGSATRALGRAVLIAKLGRLLYKYSVAIGDCYYNHFPNWTAIDNCLVSKYGLAPNVAQRLIDLLQDP